MECSWISAVWLSVPLAVAALLLFFMKSVHHAPPKSRPPGPPGWPVIGNMLDLGTMPHQALYKLRLKYGPLIWLNLGSVGTIVVQSAKAAADLFKNHDEAVSDRKVPIALAAHGYSEGSLAIKNYGQQWRALRKLCAAEFMASKRINDAAHVRRKAIDDMIKLIEDEAMASKARGGRGEVDMPRVFFLMSFNLVGNLMLSKDLLSSNSEEGHEFFDAMNKVEEWAGKPNIADFLPFLKRVDPQGIQRGMTRDMGRALRIAAGFVQERTRVQGLGIEKVKDFLDALLEYKGDGKKGPEKFSDRNIEILILGLKDYK
ncbi:Cytochrome P450 [Dillenia turbinata]|uniref:Cytochrome P450 n=1 Tax=Dillenia turbinata TaxID=194707 RepID=A0AAN8ZSI9_9MAGN